MEVLVKVENPYRCSECETRFKWEKSIPRHMKLKHSETPPVEYQCIFCHKLFSNHGNYKVHFARAHESHYLLYMEPKKCQIHGKTNNNEVISEQI